MVAHVVRAGFVVILSAVVLAAPARADLPVDEEDYELFRMFIDTVDQIERNYVKTLSRREIIDAAIEGIIRKLDQHSNYIPEDEISEFRTSVENRFGGIGIRVAPERNQLRVVSPLVDTPAYRAGIRAGDRIVEIDGETTRGITMDDALEKIKGVPGTDVVLGIRRRGQTDPLQVTLTREVIRIATVVGDSRKSDDSWDFMYDEARGIGYIRLVAFGRDTASDLRRALNELESRDLRGLILDLRFNPGGLLRSAIDVSDLFLSEGRIVSTEGRNNKPRSWDASEDDSYTGFPMAVLVNRFSASASEIVAACLQDHQRAIVIGERTWGKGSVQNVVELEGGRSALKLTTAGYLRPSGKNIHRFPDATDEDEWGVIPNDGYRLRLEDDELGRFLTHRRDRDVIRFSSGETSDDDGDSESSSDADDDDAENSDGESPAADDDASDDDASDEDGDDPHGAGPFVDRQLQLAMDYLTTELARAQ